MRIDHYVHIDPGPRDPRLDHILRALSEMRTQMGIDADAMKAANAKMVEAVQNATTALRGLAAQIVANATDPAAMKESAEQVEQLANDLNDVVAATAQ